MPTPVYSTQFENTKPNLTNPYLSRSYEKLVKSRLWMIKGIQISFKAFNV
jgi:hypothetical protein